MTRTMLHAWIAGWQMRSFISVCWQLRIREGAGLRLLSGTGVLECLAGFYMVVRKVVDVATSDQLREIHNDIRDMRREVIIIKDETTKNTVILAEHARRSSASEGRLQLLEKHAIQINWKTVGVVVSVVSVCFTIWKYVWG